MGVDPETDVIYFARTDFRGKDKLFGIKRNDRRQHVYVIGKTGTGKSVMLNNMIVQDIANGEGVCVVDPHGELVEGVLEKIPPERLKDVIYFNPADTDYHIGFNVLELPDPKYKHLVASGLMGIFTKIWANVWSARMEYIMNNAILALLETPNSTLLGIIRILVDKDYRQKIIANVSDPVVKAFWIHEYEAWQDKFRNEAIAPIQNKVGQFLSTALIRNIVGQSHSTIDIFDIMNTGKIFLVNVSKGRIGEDNSSLLGAMLITKIQLSAMERVRIPEDERVDFYLYVDEFQNFATDSFASVLSEARKYRLNLILAHQYVGQLVTDAASSKSTKIRDAIFGNVGTMIIFRVGATDAEFLEPEFEPEFVIMDIVNLPNYHIYLKLMVSGVTSRPFSASTLPPFNMKDRAMDVQEIIEYSRKRYARPREAVEEEIRLWSGMAAAGDMAVVSAAASSAVRSAGPSGAPADLSGPGFQVTCSSCSKETKVPFEPAPGRPVYCKDCLQKIKDGTLQPVRRGSRPAPGPKVNTNDLAMLGIEFKMEEKPAPRKAPEPSVMPRPLQNAPSSASPRPMPIAAPVASVAIAPMPAASQPQRRGSILESHSPEPAAMPVKASGLSLADLRAPKNIKPKKEHPHSAVNVDELRRAIAESLNQNDASGPESE
jgi:CxxC-x17-CxxC domain-containing protein